MTKAKINKINLVDAIITEDDGIFSINGTTKKEESVALNLNEELKTFVGIENLEFKLVPKKDKKPSNRKPTYKFSCPKCGKIVKSPEEEVNLKCIDCDEKLEITD